MKSDSGGFENRALSKLGELLGMPSRAPAKPADPAESEAGTPAPADTPADAPTIAGAPVVRRERKQRRGKTVTRVARLDLRTEDLKLLAREMAKALGCGARVEDEDIVVQGDQVERCAAWLERRGARRVVRGN